MKKLKQNLKMIDLRLSILVVITLICASGQVVAQNQQNIQQSKRQDDLLFTIKKSSPSPTASADQNNQSNVSKASMRPPGTTYTFTGRGSWNNASNWKNKLIPPATLRSGDQIIINGRGPCFLNNAKPILLVNGSSLEIREGKEFYISIGDNFILRGGTLSNNGKLTVLSGILSKRLSEAAINNSGQLKTTVLSKIDERKNPRKEIKKD